jgi:protease I
VDAHKIVAAVCHGPSLLVDADVLRGRRVTSWPSVKKDLQNAGAEWVDQEVVEDGLLITSRKPDDLPAFADAILRHLDRSADTLDDQAPVEGGGDVVSADDRHG